MDMEHFNFPITIRNRRAGDRFSPLGAAGTQKLKKFLINSKVPASEREKIVVLECSGKIIWVAGFRIDNAVMIKPDSQRIIRAKLV